MLPENADPKIKTLMEKLRKELFRVRGLFACRAAVALLREGAPHAEPNHFALNSH